ncbi:MAG: hypothetical protein KDK76_01065 [Chlamydiia bacterium]|nr:hypothetical protein [Chlamydiia bacterium]
MATVRRASSEDINPNPPTRRRLDDSEKNSATLSIHLIHPNGHPLMHQKIEMYAQGFFLPVKLKGGVTNKEGKFEFSFNRKEFNEKDQIILRVLEETLPTQHLLDVFRGSERVIYETQLQLDRLDLQFTIPLYEYLPKDQNYLPRLCQPENPDQRPQQETIEYKLALVKAGGDEKVKDFIARSLIKTAEIEELYGVIDPSLKLDGKTTLDLLLNGIYPCQFLKRGDGSYLVEILWNGYEKDSGKEGAIIRNVHIHIGIKNGELTIEEVVIQKGQDPWLHYAPHEKGFENALYVANSMALIKGEIVSHLGLGHLVTEQNAMAVFRTINMNPIGQLLKPHLRGVLEINRRGTDQIFGPNGILNVSGLSVNGITKALQDVMSGVCFSNFKPRKAINDEHRFARAENRYWEIVSDVVDQFFLEKEGDILTHWHEIFYLSECLVSHSMPYRAWEGKEYSEWVDTNEIDNPFLPGRVTIDGETKAMRPITTSKGGPAEGDIKRAKQFCRYAIFSATFWHWAVHTSQGKWGTNLKIASLAPREPVTLPYGDVDPQDAAKQLSLAHTFTDFDRGHLVDNIHGDIYSPLIEKLSSEEEKTLFASIGYDIGKLPFGVII